MSTIKSSGENLTLNADGANNDIKFQSNGVEKASIDQDGLVTAGGATLTGNVTVSASGADASRTLSLQGTNGSSEVYQFNLIADGGNSAAKFMVGSGGGAATEKLRIQSGGGISFNGDTAAANSLSDYEEGTFNTSSTMYFYTSGSVTMTQHILRYTKIGSLVTCTGNLYFNTVTSQSGALKIPLPFASSSGTQNRAAGYVADFDLGNAVVVKIEGGATFGTMIRPQGWTAETITNTATRLVTFSYHTDS